MDICSQCGVAIAPETTTGGLCPRCFLKLVLPTSFANDTINAVCPSCRTD